MKEYDKKYFKKFYKLPKLILNNNYNREETVKNNNSVEKIKKNKLGRIKNISCLTEGNETKNDLMMTSLHYSGLETVNNINNNNEEKKKIELKLPDIIN